jgi:hypothetical protein
VALAAGHREDGIHVTIAELVYLQWAPSLAAEAAYCQAGIDGLCWLPPADCPTDRFESLGLKLLSRRAKKGEDILILGQVPEDGQHGLPKEAWAVWYAQAVEALRANSERKIVLRPHPRVADLDLCPSADEQQAPSTPLAEASKGAWACVAYNSTAGTEALLGAIPVICSETAMYAPGAETDLAAIGEPHVGARRDAQRRGRRLPPPVPGDCRMTVYATDADTVSEGTAVPTSASPRRPSVIDRVRPRPA